MVRIVKEIELEHFDAWSGGLQVLNAIKEHDRSLEILEALENYINLGDGLVSVTKTELNDFLWFDAEDIIMDHFDIELFA